VTFVFSLFRSRSNSRIGGQIKRIGPDIIEDLLRGKKNPVQCLNEYCSMTKKSIHFTETGSGYRYANYATIDDVQFPQVRERETEKRNERECVIRICLGYREK